MAYDSTADTLLHIRRVQQLLSAFARDLMMRGEVHDDSKLGPEEKPLFDKCTPLLRKHKIDTAEYAKAVKMLEPAILHHYTNNSHHPEAFEDGIAGMTLGDIVEMFCDWKAASERSGGDFAATIESGIESFAIDSQLAAIFRNTYNMMQDHD